MHLAVIAFALLAACVIVQVGWRTAFAFAVVNRVYEHWRQTHEAS